MLIRWSVRLAVTCYVMRLVFDVNDCCGNTAQRMARRWWTAGLACFVVHVVAAFHFEYGWNHAIAFEYIAKRTAEMTGWKSGIGLYVNEAFLCLWLIDTVLWWRNLNWPRNRMSYWLVQGIFAFLMIQATAVFGPPFWKIVVSVVLAGLGVQFFRSRKNGKSNAGGSLESS